MATITRAKLGLEAARATGQHMADTTSILDRMLDLITDCLLTGEHVKLAKFGTFEIRTRAERPGRNPRTLVEHRIPERRIVHFKTGGTLQAKLARK